MTFIKECGSYAYPNLKDKNDPMNMYILVSSTVRISPLYNKASFIVFPILLIKCTLLSAAFIAITSTTDIRNQTDNEWPNVSSNKGYS